MTLGIHKLLSPEAATGDLCDGDRRRLIGLQRRVQCMVQPLNFLRLGFERRMDEGGDDGGKMMNDILGWKKWLQKDAKGL